MALLDEEFANRTFAEWKELLSGFDAPWAPVQSVAELLDDPQVTANGYIADVSDADVDYRLPASRCSSTSSHPRCDGRPSTASTPRRCCSSSATNGTPSAR